MRIILISVQLGYSMLADELTSRQLLSVLYSDHHNWLQNWLRRRLGCAHQAADLAQDTFVRILTVNDTFTELDSGMFISGQAFQIDTLREPRAYLTTVARGLMINYLKRRDLERAYLDALALQPEQVASSPETRAVVIETLLKIDIML